MTITHAQFEELKRLAAAAGPPQPPTRIHQIDARQLRARGLYLQALEQHGAELIDLAYRGAAARVILTEIAALVPLDQLIEANQTGATLVAWLRANLKTETKT